MSYFKNFPSIYYDLNRDERYKLATDVLRRVTFNQASKTVDSIYVKYDVKEGETPEEIAQNLYDNHTLYWVVLLFNDIINTKKEWPMNAETFDKYITAKYPGTSVYITFDDSTLDQTLIANSAGACATETNDVYNTGVHTVVKDYTVVTTDDTKSSVVTKWEPEWNRFLINSMTSGADFQKGDIVYIKSGTLTKAIGKVWKVSKYSETVNRFIDDNKKTLNPRGSYSGLIQTGEDIQTTAVVSSQTLSGSCDNITAHTLLPFTSTILGAYMEVSGVSNQIIQWVTNYESEQEINDEKRSISLLRPEVIADVVTQFEELVSS